MSSNYVSALISLSRSSKKAANGDKIAAFTTVGNAVKVVEKLAKIDNTWGEAARGVVDTFVKATDNSKFLQVLSPIVKLSKKGDEIGIARSAVQVATSDSPARKLIEETLGWSAKFAAKNLMLHKVPKMVQATKGISNVANKVNDFAKNNKGFGQIPTIISGIAYSLATIYGPKYARKLGGWVSDKIGLKPYEKTNANVVPKKAEVSKTV